MEHPGRGEHPARDAHHRGGRGEMKERWLQRAKHYFKHGPRSPICLEERDLEDKINSS